MTSAEGLSAITINAHSTEVASCTFDEQVRVLDIAGSEIGDKTPLVNGIWADGSLEAARLAKMATAGGASALLVFPPAPFTMGQNATMALTHFKHIADATDLPLIAFQYPLATGQGYPNELPHPADDRGHPDAQGDQGLGRHAAAARVACPHAAEPVAAVQRAVDAELVADGVAHLRLQGIAVGVRQRDRRLAGAVVPRRKAGRRRLKTAQAINDRIYPLASVFYAQPWVDMHNRMKEALVLMGKLPRVVVRPPLVKIERAEIERIRQALVQAGLLEQAKVRAA